MKKHISYLLTGFICFNIYCQDTYPFLEEGKIWGVNDCTFDMTGFPIPDMNCRLFYYKFEGDTTIHSIVYKTVYYTHDYVFNTEPVFRSDNKIFIREDETNKVYYYDSSLENEFILYDFSLSPGDSIYTGIEIQGNPLYAYVTSTDSVLVQEKYRKRLYFDEFDEVWIEGIGSLMDVVRPFPGLFVTDNYWELVSVNISGEFIYTNEIYTADLIKNCLVSEVDAVEHSNPIRIYPNPATDLLRIDINSASISYSFELFNLQGQKVIDRLIKDNATISVEELNEGVYFYRLIDEENIYTGKIVIE